MGNKRKFRRIPKVYKLSQSKKRRDNVHRENVQMVRGLLENIISEVCPLDGPISVDSVDTGKSSTEQPDPILDYLISNNVIVTSEVKSLKEPENIQSKVTENIEDEYDFSWGNLEEYE